MKKNVFHFSTMAVLFAATFSFTSCNRDNENEAEPDTRGEASIELTDAPVDNAEVEAVFVTVTDVKVDGQSFEGFSGPQTINLLAYQNGKTELIANGELSAKTYDRLSLVLDVEKDADGQTPGSYVKTVDGTKHRLAGTTQSTLEVTSTKSFTIEENNTSKLVIDFNLRKAIQETASEGSNYSFVATSKLSNALRLVARSNTGSIKGTYEDNTPDGSASDKVVVYAYKKGSFDAESETQGEVLFENAVNSSMVSKSNLSSGNFTLAFLEEGEYELHFARYRDTDQDGKLAFESMLEVSTEGGASVQNIQVDAGTNVSLSISGILG